MLLSQTRVELKDFNKIFGEFQQKFIKFAMSYVNDVEAAEDIVVDSFVKTWENRESLFVETLKSYTLTIIKNKCLNYLRSQAIRNKVHNDLYDHSQRALSTRIATLKACDPEEVFSLETGEQIRRGIDKLPEKTKDIFIQSRFKGEGYKEIAEKRGITVKSVEFEISKATKFLRNYLKEFLTSVILLILQIFD